MAKSNLDEFLQRGADVLFKQLECIEAKQRGELVMPHVPLSFNDMQTLESMLRHALNCKVLEVKVLASLHKWPAAAVQMWLMRYQDAEEREAKKLAEQNGDGN